MKSSDLQDKLAEWSPLKCSEYLKNYLEVEANVGLIKKKNNKHEQNKTKHDLETFFQNQSLLFQIHCVDDEKTDSFSMGETELRERRTY